MNALDVKIADLLRRNNLSVTDSRKKILSLFLQHKDALTHGDIEKKAGEKIKNAAQGLFTFATYGVGMFIGTWFSGFVVDRYKTGDTHDWLKIWMVPAYIAIGVLIYFLLFFREKKDIRQLADERAEGAK